MKNFNMTRFGRVLKLDFVEGRKAMMWGALCMLLLYLFFFWFAHVMGFSSQAFVDYYGTYEVAMEMRVHALCEAVGAFGVVAMFIFFLIAASTLYRDEQKKQQRIAWLMLPASNLEKFLSRWVYLLVFSLVGGLLPFFVADLIHMAYLSMTDYPVMAATDDFFHFFPQGDSWLSVTRVYAFLVGIHAFYLLGGVFFRKYHFIVTSALAVLILIFLASCYNMIGLYKYNDGVGYLAIEAGIIVLSILAVVGFSWLAYWLFCRWQVVTRKFANV
ncbi:MAG: hypothetical protein IJ588_02615 [Prevotella sp.]|nr:hypothetical protein [Prevotella sp.]